MNKYFFLLNIFLQFVMFVLLYLIRVDHIWSMRYSSRKKIQTEKSIDSDTFASISCLKFKAITSQFFGSKIF